MADFFGTQEPYNPLQSPSLATSYDPLLPENNFLHSGLDDGVTGNSGDLIPQADTGGFDFGGALKNFSLAGQGIAGIMGGINAFNQNKLMKKQFKASLAGMNRNLANSAATTNLGLRNQAQMAAQLTGNDYGSDGFNQYVADNQVQVDGSPIRV